MSTEINKRIAMYRKLLNMSQAQVADLMDMKSSTYSQMEREGTITCDRLLTLAKIFDVSPCYLLCGNIDEKNDVLREENIFDTEPKTPAFVLSQKEENFIKILRMISKEDRNDVIEFLQSKYNNAK